MDRTCRIVLVAFAFALSAAAAARAEVTQQAFFDAIATGEPARMKALMSSPLADQVDDPVLGVWMQAINERLGDVRSITDADPQTSPPALGGLTRTSALIRFERGTATSTLYSADGRLQAFAVESPELGDDWFPGPGSTQMYVRQGDHLIRTILAGDDTSACEQMHRSVRETIGLDGVNALVGQMAERWGPPQSVSLASERLDLSPDSQRLILTYNVACKWASGTCEVQIQFLGMKGHLMGFTFR